MKTGFWKKSLGLLAALMLLLGALAVEASAAEVVASGTCGTHLTWELDDEGTLTISGTGAMSNYAQDCSYSSYGNTYYDWSTSPWGEDYTKKIKKVVVGPDVTSIGEYAFFKCTNLTSVELPEGMTSIGDSAFDGCSKLSEINIPSTVTFIDVCAFENCKSLTSVEIPTGVTELKGSVFYGCGNLETVVLHEGLTSIASNAFAYCPKLIDITIPASVTTFRSDAFYGHRHKLNLYFKGATALYTEAEYVHTNVTNAATHWKLTKVYPTCTQRGYTYYACACGYTRTTTYTDPALPHTYDNNVCIDCGYMNPDVIGANGTCGGAVTWTLDLEGKLVISGMGEMTKFASAEETPWYGSMDSILRVEIAPGVTSVGDHAFHGAANLESVEFPGTLTSIGASAFEGCGKLTGVQLPENLTFIGTAGFSGCASLTEMVIPEGVTALVGYTFYGCSGMNYVVIPESVKSFGVYTFNACTSLEDIYYGGTLSAWTSLSRRPSADYIHVSCTTPQGHWEHRSAEATCTAAGYSYDVCSCGYQGKQQEAEPALGHTEVIDWAVAENCTESGLTEGKHCSVCNEILVAQEEIPALGHAWSDFMIGEMPGCATEGLQFRECSTCYEVEEKAIAPTGDHSWTEWVISEEASCLIGGKMYRDCVVCEKHEEKWIPVTDDHTWTEWQVKTPATCTEEGIQYRECTVCTKGYEEAVIEATGHNHIPEVVDPTCLMGGYTRHTCENCGDFYDTDYTEASEHSWTEETVYEPTCVIDGFTLSSCDICGIMKYDVIPATDHNYISEVTEATCEAADHTRNTCICCGHWFDDTFTEILSHTWTAWEGSEASCSSESYQIRSCIACGEVDYRVNSAAQHEWNEWTLVFAAGCEHNGFHYRTCAGCSQIGFELLPATGHKFSKGTCSVCGLADPNTVALTITQQPENVAATQGNTAKVTVQASGEGLTYKWYYKDKSATKFTLTTSFKSNTYYVSMTAARSGRQVYCVITDKHGNTVTTDTVTLSMASGLTITQQPKDVVVTTGTTAKVVVKAAGDDLTYKWYYKNANASTFTYTSSFKSNYYSITMDASRSGRQVYCVITDKNGDTVQTVTVTLSMKGSEGVTITSQPKDVTVANGVTAKTTVQASGEGLSYQWFIKNAGKTTFSKSSVTTNTYATKMSSAADGRQVYCIITDAKGNTVQTQTITLTMSK